MWDEVIFFLLNDLKRKKEKKKEKDKFIFCLARKKSRRSSEYE